MAEPDLQKKTEAFSALGKEMRQVACLLNQKLNGGGDLHADPAQNPVVQSLLNAVEQSQAYNPWFTREETARALGALAHMLQKDKLEAWISRYRGQFGTSRSPKTVAVIMAGNIPLVGFHDFMCVLMAGHRFFGKLSSQDPVLPVTIAHMLSKHAPGLEHCIKFTSAQIDPGEADAVIATGSDNTARYFEYRFGNKPHIIRKNRNSAALLSGREPDNVLADLGEDVFSYFGLGCRNVSHLLIPEDFDLARLSAVWAPYRNITTHPKYSHNLRYHRALFTLKDKPFTDAGCCLFTESPDTASPVSVVHFSRYSSFSEAGAFLRDKKEQLQCVVAADSFFQPKNEKGDRPHDEEALPAAGNTLPGLEAIPPDLEAVTPGIEAVLPGTEALPPGKSQYPDPDDYADGADTMEFLLGLP